MDNIATVLLVIAVVIGPFLGFTLGRRQGATEVAGLQAQIVLLQEQAAQRQADSERERELHSLLQPLAASVTELQRKAEEARVQQAGSNQEILTNLKHVQDASQRLSAATSELKDAFSRTQSVGRFGELQLEGLLAGSGLIEGVHYRTQVTMGETGDRQVRPDVMLYLPDGSAVPIDSKCPLDAYQAAMATEDDDERRLLQARHAEAVLAHAKSLSKKGYAGQAAGPDLVVLFLPFDSLLLSAHQSDPGLVEKCYALNVVLASPSSLIGILRTTAFGWQRNQIAEFTREIGEAAARVLKQLSKTIDKVDKVGRGLQSAMGGYNELVRELENGAVKSAKSLHQAGVTSAAPQSKIGQLELAPRELTNRLVESTEVFADEVEDETDESRE